MRHVPKLRGLRTRKLVPALAMGAVAMAGAMAPATQAAQGPPQTINKEVELNCTLVTPFFEVPNLQLFVGVNATVPSWVTPGEQANIEDSFALIRIPPRTAGALSVVSADTVAGIAEVFNLALTNADPEVVNVTETPVAYGPQLVPAGQETTLRVPGEGVLPDVGPITATGPVGSSIEARLIRLETTLRATSSTNPSIDQQLPFFCDNAAGADNLVSSIPIQEAPAEAPAITSIAPTEGDVAGGTEVTITGTGFTDATSVTFGGTEATSFTVNSDTSITAVAPAGAEGTVDVVVTTAAGASANTAADDFTYTDDVEPPVGPAITGIDPNEGDVAGGTEVTITGTGFTDATSVTFGGTEATSFTVNSDTSITAVAPAGAAGTVDVVVTTPEGASENTAADDFTYTEEEPPAGPAVSGISPTSGDVAGGTAVTITGSGFTGATGVSFGGTAAASFEVVSDTSITAVSPAGAAGTVDVVVTTPEGASENTAADDFTYTQDEPPAGPPVVTGVSPNSGPESGGNTVVITGTDLAGATKVRFGNNVAQILSNTGTEITVKAPAGTGTVDVRVVVDGLTSRNSAADDYTYIGDKPPVGKNPTVKKLFPDWAIANIGGITVVKGTNLDTTKKVTVGGKKAQFIKVSKTELIVLLPPLKRGTYDLVVTNKYGSSEPSNKSEIEYVSLFRW